MNNEIFGYFVSNGVHEDDNKRVSYMLWFLEHFPADEFHGMDRILYEYVSFSGKLKVPLKLEYANVFCKHDLRKFLIDKHIKVEGTEDLNYSDPAALENAKGIITERIRERIVWFENNSEEYDLQSFIVSAKQFIRDQLDSRLTDVLSGAFDFKSEKDDPIGALSWARTQLENVSTIYDEGCLEELDPSSETGIIGGDVTFVCDTGLPGIDSDITGIYTTQLGGLEAATGVGKTRFALGVWAYRAAVCYHKNVLYYGLEQSKQEYEAMLLARHTYELFQIQVADELIWKHKIPEEAKAQVEAARIDLFESGKYGKIHIVASTLYSDDFVDNMWSTDKRHGPFDMIIIDYMGYISDRATKGRQRASYEVIGQCYKDFKRYVRQNNKCGIAVNQLNSSGTEASNADKAVTTTMGQGGMEVYRNTDFNLSMTCTQEMRLQNKRRISQPKARSSAGAAPLIVDTRLGICLFYQQAKSKV